MKSKTLAPRKNKAQAMVEFAIALPILLMLLYGILEAGRLLFLYSTIVTASRQAVRYGSATGVGTGGVFRYQDCAGIRAIANKADFLNAFDDSDIYLYHDTGPNTAVTPYCTGPSDPNFSPSTNDFRLIVEIKGDFFPIVPRLVPFIERSQANNNPITAESARTILVAVSIEVTAPPSTWEASTPTYTFTPTIAPTNTPTRTPTPTLSPTPLITDTPSVTPTITLSPTITYTPTASLTPTSIPTGVTGCNSITHGTIAISGSSLTLTINSPVPASVQIQDIFLVWNHDKGHLSGGDKTLHLNTVSIGSQTWSGAPLPSNGPSVTVTSSPAFTIPTGTSTITFTFHQSYDNLDGSEEILINLASPGCTAFPIHAP